MTRPAVLVVDMVNDFVTGVFGNERSQAMVPRLAALLAGCRADGIPVIYCSDSHLEGVDVELKVHPNHALRGTWGADIVPELLPKPTDFSLTKRRYSAFFGTELEPLLRELGIDTVIVTGVATNGCVRHTAADAFFHGFKVIVVSDCVESRDESSQQLGIEQMERAYGAQTVLAKELGAVL
ncbi:MAG: cysteine hydrolase family protein [Chloroflexota bacterium]